MTIGDGVREPLIVGGAVPLITHSGKGDLSDWVELVEVVEALCPIWPPAERPAGGEYRL